MQVTPEQQAELQEKMKNMSAAELAELQKEYCLFCKIASGDVPAKTIYEDEHCIAILDIHPATPGHVLLLPKQHALILAQLPRTLNDHLAKVMKHLSQVLLRALEVQGTSILIQNGESAGQKAQHAMIHIIPRTEEDNLALILPRNNAALDTALTQKLAQALQDLEQLPEQQATPPVQEQETPVEEEKEEPTEEAEEEQNEPVEDDEEIDELEQDEEETGESTEAEQDNMPELTTDFSDILSSLSGENDEDTEETPEQNEVVHDNAFEEEEGDEETTDEDDDPDSGDDDEDDIDDNDDEQDVQELSLDDTEEEGDDVEELDLDKLSEELHRGL